MHFPPDLAFIGPDMLGVMIPIIALIIPVVAILTKHQQKMAEIIHQGGNAGQVNALRQEVAELRDLVHRQAFAIDQLNGLAISNSQRSTENLSARLQQ